MNIELIKEITYQDKKTLSERALKLSEETGEVAEAVLSYTNACGCSYKHKTRKDILENFSEEHLEALKKAVRLIIEL